MFFRIIKSFIFIIISVAILGGGFFAGIYSRDYYKAWQDRRDLRNLVSTYEQAQKDEEARKMADTYGGKTPQETLQMFIDAVEKGDYELASKYFVESKREEWTIKLSSLKNINVLIDSLNESINNNGEYSIDSNGYTIYKPAITSFVLYPNGIWKLTEI